MVLGHRQCFIEERYRPAATLHPRSAGVVQAPRENEKVEEVAGMQRGPPAKALEARISPITSLNFLQIGQPPRSRESMVMRTQSGPSG